MSTPYVQAMSGSFLWQKIPLTIAISFAILEQSRVIGSFVFACEAGKAHSVVICINPILTQTISGTEQKTPKSFDLKFAKHVAWYNEFWL